MECENQGGVWTGIFAGVRIGLDAGIPTGPLAADHPNPTRAQRSDDRHGCWGSAVGGDHTWT